MPDVVEVSAGNASLQFRANHSGKLRTLAVWVYQEGPVRGDRVFGHMQAMAHIALGREQAMAFLTDMAKGDAVEVNGGNASLTYGWDQSHRGFGYQGTWCLTVKKHGYQRALRRFPLDSLGHAHRLATQIIEMLNADVAESPTEPEPAPAPTASEPLVNRPTPTMAELTVLQQTGELPPPKPTLVETPPEDKDARIQHLQAMVAGLEHIIADLREENRKLCEMVRFLNQYRPEQGAA